MRPLSVKQMIYLFAAVSIVIILLVLILTSGPKTIKALKEMKLSFLLLCFSITLISALFDVLRVYILAKGVDKSITFLKMFEINLSYIFVSSITPTSSGGEPVFIFFMTKRGLNLGKATAVILIRGFLHIFLIGIATPIIVFFHREFIFNKALKLVFNYAAIFFSYVVIMMFLTIFKPQIVRKFFKIILIYLGKIRFLRKFRMKMIKKVDYWVIEFNKGLHLFIQKKIGYLILSTIFTIFYLLFFYSIAYVILLSLNYKIPLLDVIMMQFVLFFLLYFSPTPGGTGIAEGGFYILFSHFVPNHLMGIYLVLWRFFTLYLWVIFGGIISLRKLGLKQIATFKEG